MTRVGHAHRHDADLVPLPRVAIAQMAIVPRPFAARNLPGFALLAPPVEQLLALLPAQHETDIGLEEDLEPGSTGELAVPNVAELPPPGLPTALEQRAHLRALVRGALAATRPPAHRGHHGRSGAAEHEQAKPVHSWNTDRAAARWIEEAWADAFEPAGFAGAHRAQPFALDTLGLLQHTPVPDQQRS